MTQFSVVPPAGSPLYQFVCVEEEPLDHFQLPSLPSSESPIQDSMSLRVVPA